jgi:SAM-dependent methyltransferase
MHELELIVDLHLRNPRQGPGGATQTDMAIAMTWLPADEPQSIADIGCGTGASAVQLAAYFKHAQVVAVDAMGAFVERGRQRVRELDLGDRVEVRVGDMRSLEFAPGSLDLIWSEGAIYNMGFDAGIAAWRDFLRPGGVIAVSELTWTTRTRPAEIEAHWSREYPGIRQASENVRALERAGYGVLGHFMLPTACWEDNYYRALEDGFDSFLDRHGGDADAQRVLDAEREEIRLYRAYGAWYSYGFYVARRLEGD